MKKFIWCFSILCTLVVIAIMFKVCTLESMVDEDGKKVLVYFPMPDKILIYKDGNTQSIPKDSKIFSDMVIKMNSRVNGLSTASCVLDKESMEKTKKNEIVIEFTYSKKQKLKGAGPSRKFSGLLFPLTGDLNNMCFLDENRNSYTGPVGPLNNVGDVLKLVK